MLTYLLRKTVLNYKDNAAIIQSKLSEIALIVANDKAKEIAKISCDNVWQWHYYLGFLFAALLAYRIHGFITKAGKLQTCKAKELK